MMMLQVAAPTPPPDPVIVQTMPFPDPNPFAHLPPGVLLLMVLGVVAGAVAIFFPLMRAIARRIEGKSKPDAALLEEIEQLRSQVHDLEGMQSRIAELEERVDFTERLLAQKSEPRELGR